MSELPSEPISEPAAEIPASALEALREHVATTAGRPGMGRFLRGETAEAVATDLAEVLKALHADAHQDVAASLEPDGSHVYTYAREDGTTAIAVDSGQGARRSAPTASKPADMNAALRAAASDFRYRRRPSYRGGAG